MKKKTFLTIVSMLLVLIFVSVGRVASEQADMPDRGNPTPSPEFSPTPTPTPSLQEVSGVIEEIGDIVDYKNSVMARVKGSVIYITEETRIVDAFDQEVDRSVLSEGTVVIVEGVPAEGGLDASRIIVVIVATTPTLPSAPTQPTITPKPAV